MEPVDFKNFMEEPEILEFDKNTITENTLERLKSIEEKILKDIYEDHRKYTIRQRLEAYGLTEVDNMFRYYDIDLWGWDEYGFRQLYERETVIKMIPVETFTGKLIPIEFKES